MTEKNWSDDQDSMQANTSAAQEASAGRVAPAPQAEETTQAKPTFQIWDDYGYLKGEVTEGTRTDDPALSFKGQGLTEGQEVTVKAVLESGEVMALGVATVRKNGHWSISPNLSFVQEGMEGVVDFFITVEGVDSDPVKGVVIDRIRPEEIALESMQVLGGVLPVTIEGAQSQVQINAQRPVFDGKFSQAASPEDLQHVRIVIKKDGKTILGDLPIVVSVAADGSWHYDWPEELVGQGGDYTLAFYMMDDAGNSPEAAPGSQVDKPFLQLELQLDFVAPDEAELSLTLHDDFGPVTGIIAAGGKTDDATPALKGKVENFDATDVKWVEIFLDGTSLGTVLVDDQGNWEFTPEEGTVLLGEHSFEAYPVDAAGNRGANGAAIDFEVVDPAVLPNAPVINQIEDGHGSVTGLLNDGDVTDDTSLSVSGTAEAGNLVLLYVDGELVASATADEQGNWTTELPLNGEDGEQVITAKAQDEAGRHSDETAPVSIVLDTTAPDKPGQAGAEDNEGVVQGPIGQYGTTNDNTPEFSGQAEPDAVVIISDNGKPLGSVVADAEGNWSYTPEPPLDDGSHSITVQAQDAAGNLSEPSDALEFSVWSEAPQVQILHALDAVDPTTGPVADNGSTNDNRPTLVGTATAGALVIISEAGIVLGSVQADAGGNWSLQLPLFQGDGPHTYSAEVQSATGEFGRDDFTLTIDTRVPDRPLIDSVLDNVGAVTGALQSGDTTDDANPILEGSDAEPNGLVKVYDNNGPDPIASITADENGNWSLELPELADGEHRLTVTVSDTAGNESKPSRPFELTVDTAVPTDLRIDRIELVDDFGPVTGVIANGGSTDDAAPLVQGHVEGEAQYVEIYDGATLLGTALVDSEGNWSFQAPDLAAGEHNISARPVNAIGQVGEASESIGFTVVGEETPLPPMPVISEIIDGEGSVTGLLNDGDVTDDASLSLSGTAEAGDTVLLYVNGELAASVVADEQGNWSVDLPLTGDGEKVITAKAQDEAGRHSEETAPVSVILDTTAPEQPDVVGAEDNAGAITGPIEPGSVTDEAQPTLSGSGEPGDTVSILDNGEEIGTAVIDENGHWEFTPEQPLEEGDHSISVVITDPAGNASQPSESLDFSVDTSVPPMVIDRIELIDDVDPVTGVIANGGSTDDAAPLVQGHVEGEAQYVEIYDGQTLLGTALVDGEGNWSFQAPELASGEHSISARPVNAIGQEGEASESIGFTVVGEETLLPPMPVISEIVDGEGSVIGLLNDGDVTDDASLSVSGTAEAGNLVLLYVNGELAASVVADEQGNWSTDLPLAGDGEKAITAKAQDEAGRHSDETAPVSVILDTTAPEQPDVVTAEDNTGAITGPIEAGSVTDEAQPTLSGSGEPGDTVSILDKGEEIGTAVIDENGHWEFTPEQPLEEGDHSISVVVTDPAGNAGEPSDALEFVVDTAPPFVTIDVAIDEVGNITGEVLDGGVTDDRRPTLKGTATPDALVVIKEGPVVYGSVVADAEGNWSLRLPLSQSDGDHVYIAEVQNAAGNSAQAEFVLVIDTQLPDRPVLDSVLDNVGAITGPLLSGDTTDDANPTLKGGDAEPNGLVKVYDNGKLIASTTADEYGEWRLDLELEEGEHRLTVTACDEAGSESRPTRPFDLTVDTSQADLRIDQIELIDDFGPVTGAIVDGGKTDDTTPVLKGHVEGTNVAYVEIYDGETLLGSAPVDEDGNWEFEVPERATGEHVLSAVPVDSLGKNGEASDSIRFEVVGPEVTSPSAPVISEIVDGEGSVTGPLNDGDVTDDTSLSVSGTAEAGNLVLLYVNGELAASVIADENGNWSTDLPLAGDGEKAITAKAQDEAGRHSDETAPVAVILDTTAPEQPDVVSAEDNAGAITGPIEPGSVTDETQPTLSGSGEPGDSVSILDNGEEIGTAVIDENGHWEFTPEEPLEEGDHSISVVITDPAGNASQPSESLDFSVDTSVPP
ncbi:Ig-like domain-containing protein, partial [Pseudomonas sp. JH-2]|uniref:Ig-like domain-containing protein n=1 Tax=Pseudomonas sp. JH-2 TaxID=3114998 RepID=UPI002E2751F1|nr:Ig-like domain-containing protein [Pseudomonas sp. JH-2]